MDPHRQCALHLRKCQALCAHLGTPSQCITALDLQELGPAEEDMVMTITQIHTPCRQYVLALVHLVQVALPGIGGVGRQSLT